MRIRTLAFITAALPLLPATAAPLQAQDGFLFSRPQGQVTLRAGPVLHRAGGDVFEFITSELTLDRGDFRAPSLGGELAVYAHSRVDVVLGVAWSRFQSRSEFRDWVEEDEAGNDQPIEQTTSLRLVPATVSARYYPLSRGRSVSNLAWLPARTTPYFGGGAGVTWYRLRQVGDFVSQETDPPAIFSADYQSAGRAVTGHVLAGVDHWFTARVGLNLEGRYTLGSATPGNDFQNWDSIDLSGLQVGLGLSLRW